MRRVAGALAACALGVLVVAGVASSSAASRDAPRVALPTGVAGHTVSVDTPQGFVRGRLESPVTIVDKDPDVCPTSPGAQRIAACFTRRRSVVPNATEMYRIASDLGGPGERAALGTCGPLVQYHPGSIRPASCIDEALIHGYNVEFVLTSVVQDIGGHLSGGLTQAAPPYPGGTQILVYVVDKKQ